MMRILVVGPKKDYQRIIDVLYQAGSIHLEDAKTDIPDGMVVRPLDTFHTEELSSLLIRIRGQIQILTPVDSKKHNKSPFIDKYASLPFKDLVVTATTICDSLEEKLRSLENR